MYSKLLVRKDHNNDSLILIFVPSLTAPKGYIKRWEGGTNYADVSIDSYKATRDTDPAQQRQALKRYEEETKLAGVKVAQRIPRDYQQTPSEDDFRVLTRGISHILEDSKGVFIGAYTDLDQAIREMENLKMGKSRV